MNNDLKIESGWKSFCQVIVVLGLGVGFGFGMRAIQSSSPVQSSENRTEPKQQSQRNDGVRQLKIVPQGTTVMLDGRILGVTPEVREITTSGVHVLRLEKEGYRPHVMALKETDFAGPLELELQPVQFAILDVKSNPEGAEVMVDGKFEGRTPVRIHQLRPGPHQVVVRKANHASYVATHVLQAGETAMVDGIRLENNLERMLVGLRDAEPRHIGTYLDLGHFYFIQGRMPEAVSMFLRASELSKLPLPPPPAGTPPEEIEVIRNNYYWDRNRVNSEIKKHLHSADKYYGSHLDFNTFRTEYAKRQDAFKAWASRNTDIQWIVEQARKESAAGNHLRVIELYGDHLLLKPKSAVALAGLAASWIREGDLRAGMEAHAKAVVLLKKPAPTPSERLLIAPAWIALGEAWRMQAMRTAEVRRKPHWDKASECFDGAVTAAVAENRVLAEVWYHRSMLAKEMGDVRQSLAFIQESGRHAEQYLADMKTAGKRDRLEDARRLKYRLRLKTAFQLIDLKRSEEAVKLLEDVLANSESKSLQHLQASEALEALSRGQTPAPPPDTEF